jgi:hypothetical protein
VRRVSTPEKPLHRSTALVAVVLAALAAQCTSSERAPGAAASLDVCSRRFLDSHDVNGILRAPMTRMERGPGDVRTCVFRTATRARIELAVRPSGGTTTVQRWIEGALPLEAAPLNGVGDRAAWQRDLHEVIAERNDVLCDITALGEPSDFVNPSDDFLEARLGSLCAKVLGAKP